MHRVPARPGPRPRYRARRPRFDALEPRLAPATFTVTNTNDEGPGSLRQAILDANGSTGADAIAFHIGSGPQTIQPRFALPTITDPVAIDGTTQPGFAGTPLIELDGSGNPNGPEGLIVETDHTTIRGLVIDGFSGAGIELNGAPGAVVASNVVAGNVIGGGLGGPGNGIGVAIFGAGTSGNVIGGMGPGERNLISGNVDGIILDNGATNNQVLGNSIGTDASGTKPLGNDGGVIISGAGTSGNIIGGAAAGAGNLISANGKNGIFIENGATGNRVLGNLIGTDVTGRNVLAASAPPPGLPAASNTGDGVLIAGASDNLIGGTDPGAGNVIAGSGSHGVEIGPGSDIDTGNIAQGNAIGTDRAGALNLGNAGSGVYISSSDEQVGGLAPGAGNLIAFNGRDGVSLPNSGGMAGTGDAILGNSIYANAFATGGLGIDLNDDGPTPQGSQGPGAGANNLQNPPVLTQTANPDGTVTVAGSLRSAPGTAYTLQFFSNAASDPEGRVLLRTLTQTTDGSGLATFRLNFSGIAGRVVTATATDPAGNTSEFSLPQGFVSPSADLTVAIAPGGRVSTAGLHAAAAMEDCTYTVSVRNDSPQPASGVLVKSILPDGATYESSSASKGRTIVNGDIITLEAGTLAPGESATLTIAVQAASMPGAIRPRAEVDGNPVDPDPGNNRAVAPICSAPPGDFDGDGKADVAVYDQTDSQYFILLSGGGARTPQFGNPAHRNVSVSGDFDGDGKADFAIYDQTNSQFFILLSGGGALTPQFGDPSHLNIPVGGDFDGDGRTDVGVYDQTTSQYFILLSGGGARTPQFGNPAHQNVPIASDFDGDGRDDIAIYDQTASQFFVLLTGGGARTPQFGNPADRNVPITGGTADVLSTLATSGLSASPAGPGTPMAPRGPSHVSLSAASTAAARPAPDPGPARVRARTGLDQPLASPAGTVLRRVPVQSRRVGWAYRSSTPGSPE
jgi:uncharacterized repeat protein (TIGR01451 family)